MVGQSRSGLRNALYLLPSLLICAIVSAGLVLAVASGRSVSASASSGQIGLRVVTERAVGPAAVEVSLRSADGTPVENARVSLRGDMNHAGMRPVIVEMREVGRGAYLSDEFRFTMAGDWLLTVTALLPSGEKLERTFDVSGIARE